MQKDFIIVLAWPEGMVAAAGGWYDRVLSTDGKYRVGHSALILVNSATNQLNYFDFGRYHSPFGFGRTRDLETDPDISLKSKPIISKNSIVNIKEILLEISNLKATHGNGSLYASILKNIDFNKAYEKAKEIQNMGLISYGPVVLTGTNCSRFVTTVMLASKPHWFTRLRLKYPFCLFPSPKRNISIANSNYYVVSMKNYKQINKSFLKAYFSSIERI
tara:strand:- start:50 stop:703 length:654 start_codon:yes stop_codon:yes gene_type:complete